MISYSISKVLKNPFLMKFLMEVMIQQMPFGFPLEQITEENASPLVLKVKAELLGFQN